MSESGSSLSSFNEQVQIQIAVILMRLVPSRSFTDQIALFCAGMRWDYITRSYKYPKSNLEMRVSNEKRLIEQNYGSKHIYLACHEKSIKERYKYFVQFASRWPKRIDTFTPESCGVERSAAIILVGGMKEMTAGKTTTFLYRI